jgi:hypothetical protein
MMVDVGQAVARRLPRVVLDNAIGNVFGRAALIRAFI